MEQAKEERTERVLIRSIGGLIIIVGMTEILKVVGIEPAKGFGLLRALLLLGAGLYIAFRKK